MSQPVLAILALSIAATATVVANRFVTVAGAQAGAAANTLGVANYGVATGEIFPVSVMGTAMVEAGAVIALGAAIETDAAGKAVTKSAGPTVGRALQAASGDGKLIQVLLIPN